MAARFPNVSECIFLSKYLTERSSLLVMEAARDLFAFCEDDLVTI